MHKLLDAAQNVQLFLLIFFKTISVPRAPFSARGMASAIPPPLAVRLCDSARISGKGRRRRFFPLVRRFRISGKMQCQIRFFQWR